MAKRNYGYTTISNYDAGRNQPAIRELIVLADLLGTSIDYVVGRTDEKEIKEKEPKLP